MSVKPKIRLSFEGENLTLNYDLDNFSFKDFDYFVRQRFQIEQDAGLKYSQDFEEILPSASCLQKGPLLVTELRRGKEKKAGTSHKGTHVDHYWLYASTILAAFAIAISPRSATGAVGAKFFTALDSLTLWLGLPSPGLSNTEWRTLYIEAFVTFMCRAVTELVIRRGCNPENNFHVDSVLRRFSIDSVYAGLAASVAIFVRRVALGNLR